MHVGPLSQSLMLLKALGRLALGHNALVSEDHRHIAQCSVVFLTLRVVSFRARFGPRSLVSCHFLARTRGPRRVVRPAKVLAFQGRSRLCKRVTGV